MTESPALTGALTPEDITLWPEDDDPESNTSEEWADDDDTV